MSSDADDFSEGSGHRELPRLDVSEWDPPPKSKQKVKQNDKYSVFLKFPPNKKCLLAIFYLIRKYPLIILVIHQVNKSEK